MSLLVHLPQLDDRNTELAGELPVAELNFGIADEAIHFAHPLEYALSVQHLQDSLLVTGVLDLALDCECVRCLTPFPHRIRLSGWACYVPLTGEDAPKVTHDSVDLTPYIREDMVLALPTHPVCRNDCPGLTGDSQKTLRAASGISQHAVSPWDELNKLKLKS